MASYTSPTDNTIVTFPGKIILNNKEMGTYGREVLSETPIQLKVFGEYDTSKAPQGGGGDALHSFQSRVKDKFGGRMNDAIILAMLEIYERGINPYVQSLKVEFSPKKNSGPKVIWEAILTESPDGKAYVGFQSRGGAGNVSSGTAVQRAEKQAKEKKRNLPKELGEPNLEFLDVLDYRNPEAAIRQIFWQYTKPKKYPAKSKSGVSPASAPSETNTNGQTTGTQSTGGTNSNTGQTDAKSQNTKIKLVKKSGPGELMGEVEKEVYDGEVTFTGLQFDQPGEYVISAVPSSSEIETKDFNITVSGQVEQPQEPKAAEEEKIEGSRPIIAQIDKPTYYLNPIQFDTTQDSVGDRDYAKNLGFNPFFWYMGYQINQRDIISLSLYHEGLIPKVSISFYDSLGFMKKEGFPLDNTKFEVFINSGSENLKSIHLRFKVENFQNNRKGNYTIVGTLDLKDFYKPIYKSYTGTSFEVLRQISKESELGFNSNITNTTDSMKWTNTGKLPKDFMTEIIAHSYISDDSFLIGYIDFYYAFNYVDIEKEWKRDISADLGIISQGAAGAVETPPTGDEEKIKRLRLTNDKTEQGTNLGISKYTLNNNSTKQSITKGQFKIAKFYDTFSKSFLIFNIDSLSSEGDKTIILKGSPNDKKELETNYRTEFKGRVDLENVHKNYLYAQIQNKTNFENLARITVDIELPNPNFNLYRFQKIEITFVNDKSTITAPENIQTRISGEWIILEIMYSWMGGKMSQRLVCARKELGKLPDELKNQEVEKDQESNTERNENPTETTDGIVPNSVYQVGEVYLTRDKDGKEYTITITEISSNGIEVTTSVIESPGTGLTASGVTASGVTASGVTASGVTASGVTASVPESTNPNELPEYYIVSLAEPKSENDKNIVGTITFNKIGPKKEAVGNLEGFPDGGKIGPVKGQQSPSETSVLADEMIIILQNQIITKYSVDTKLKISEKKFK